MCFICWPVAFRNIFFKSILILFVYILLWILVAMTSVILHLLSFLPSASNALASSLSYVAW